MADISGMDPQLLAKLLMQGQMPGQRPPTQGAGPIMPPRSPSFGMQPKPMFGGGMGGVKQPTVPGAGQIPPNLQGMPDDPHGTDPKMLGMQASQFPAQSVGPFPAGGSIPGVQDMATGSLKATTGNDPRNPLADQLIGMRQAKDPKAMYDMALAKQQMNRPQPPQQQGQPQQSGPASVLGLDRGGGQPMSGMVNEQDIDKAIAALRMYSAGVKDPSVKKAVNAQLTSVQAYPQMQAAQAERIKDWNLFQNDRDKYVETVVDRHLMGPGKSDVAIHNYERQQKGLPPLSLQQIREGMIGRVVDTITKKGEMAFMRELQTDLDASQKHLDNTARTIKLHAGE